jgi:hypothetical protein
MSLESFFRELEFPRGILKHRKPIYTDGAYGPGYIKFLMSVFFQY